MYFQQLVKERLVPGWVREPLWAQPCVVFGWVVFPHHVTLPFPRGSIAPHVFGVSESPEELAHAALQIEAATTKAQVEAKEKASTTAAADDSCNDDDNLSEANVRTLPTAPETRREAKAMQRCSAQQCPGFDRSCGWIRRFLMMNSVRN
jgi:hypothetical protein